MPNLKPTKTGLLRLCDRTFLYSLAFIIFFLPLYSSLTSIGIGFAIVFLIVSKIFSKKILHLLSTPLTILVFVFLSSLSIFYSATAKESIIGLRKLWMYFFIFLAIVNTLTNIKSFKFIIFILGFSAFSVSLDGVYQLINGKDWFSSRPLFPAVREGLIRVTASFHEPGSLGIYLGPVLVLLTAFFLFHFSGFKKALLGIMISIIFIILLFTLAPGAALGFYFAIAFFAIIKRKWSLIFVLAILLTSAIIFLPPSLNSWPNGTFFLSIKGRFMMAQIALKMIMVHPFIGFGLHTFPLVYQKFCLPGYPFYNLVPPYAHNMYLQMAAEIGLLGLLSFIALMAGVFNKLWAVYKTAGDKFVQTLSLGLMGSFIAYLTHGMLESSIYTSQGALLFWILLGFSISLINFKAGVDF